MKDRIDTPPLASGVTRRRFLTATAASTLALALNPASGLADEQKPKVNIGLIGCGGRGNWIAGLFQNHGGFNVTAVADYFQDRADAAGKAFKAPAERRFTGLNGYRRLLDQKLDAVVIESPPWFHPEQAAAAVGAGKHVYLAKPVAVDVPGCQSVEKSGQEATAKNLVFLVDFQARTDPLLQDFATRLRKGEVGRIISAEASYHTGAVGETADKARRANPKDSELRLRAWVTDQALSGDIITEQNIHAIDMACWLLEAAPTSACGACGKHRDFVGNCHDQFSVIYEFPGEITVTFNSKQVGFGIEDIQCRVFGESGTVQAAYSDNVFFKSKEDFKQGEIKNLYHDGAVANIATFYDSITRRDYRNPTVAPSVRSNLTTILGRTAAYQNGRVTWKEMIAKAETSNVDLRGLRT
jgi:myo-inositol 2-dehydrogenase / D-chiro-inositol 1-dehydrogenase